MLDDHVNRLRRDKARGWTYLDLKVEHFESFREANGFVAADEVLHMMAGLLREIVAEYGTDSDFVTHPADDHFVTVTHAADADGLAAELASRFNEGAQAHYSFMDREMGFLT